MELVRQHKLFELVGDGDAWVPYAAVANDCGISHEVLQRLSITGSVSSKPGRPECQLGKDSAAISLLDVVSAPQGTIESSKCVRDGRIGDRSKSRPLPRKRRELEGLVIGFLRQATSQGVLTSSR